MSSNFRSIFLYTLLAFLPLLVLDGGWLYLRFQDQDWQLQDLEERARQVLESMEQNWPVRRQITIAAERFRQTIPLPQLMDEETNGNPLHPLNEAINRSFGPPFPPPQIWMFRIHGALEETPVQLLLAKPENRFGKTGPASFFRFLFRHHQKLPLNESETKRGQALTEQYLGKGIPGHLVAGSQKGTVFPVIYERKFYWFIWDYVESAGKAQVGFILLIPNVPASQGSAFEMVRRVAEEDPRFQKGFIRFFQSEIGDILPASLARSGVFRRWLQRWRATHDLFKVEQTSVPWKEAVGNRLFFFRILPDCTHFAFVSYPRLAFGWPPPLLLFGNILFLVVAVFVIFRGLLTNNWGNLNLQARFSGMYLFATALPLTLAIIGGVIFLREREETLHFQLQNRLLRDLQKIDQNKDLSRSRYISAFHQAVQDSELLKELKEFGLSRPVPYERALSYFQQTRSPLPLAALYLADWKGNLLGKEFPPPTGNQDLAFLIRFYRAGLVLLLRKNLEVLGRNDLASGPAPLDDLDKMLVAVHRQGSSVHVTNVFQENRLLPDLHQVGNLDLTKLHELITIDGLYLYSLLVFWRNNDLDVEILKEQRQLYLREAPRSLLTAYRTSGEELEPLFPEVENYQQTLRQIARTALKRRGSVKRFDSSHSWLFVALPTRNLKDIVLVAGTPLKPITDEIEKLRSGFLLLAFSSLGIIILLGWITGKHVIEPITRVKQGVEAIVQGNFHVRVALERPDELGQLTKTFDAMITRLEERERLATLVSGKVLDAFSGGSDLDTATRARRIDAVILVSDIRNFTTLSEQHPEKTMTSLLNNHFDQMNEAIVAMGGRIDKFIGDAIHAVFETDANLNHPPEDRAIRAGVQMLERLQVMNENRHRNGLFGYRIGIGISSGEVILGGLGDPEYFFDYTIIGSPLKEAEHLETLSKQIPHFPLVLSPRVAQASSLAAGFRPLAGHEDAARVLPEPQTLRL